ncbi:MAG: helix-turn-helix domain-containing protein, partial [Roseiflexus sp.]|nr:helix-turn-helix domain-containing protein [Roseiflexus sp.]
PRSYRLLRYLYENRTRRVPRSELYYRAYQGLVEEPRAHNDRGWEDPANWNNVLDNALLRLRKIIEPDPRHPVYILTDRGWGVKLENAI